MALIIQQPRLTGARLGHYGHDLPVATRRERQRAVYLAQFALAADEGRQPTSRRQLEVAAQRPGACHIVNDDGIGDSLDRGRSQGAQFKVTLD